MPIGAFEQVHVCAQEAEEVGRVLARVLGGDSVCMRSAVSAGCSPVPAPRPKVSMPMPGLCPDTESPGLFFIARRPGPSGV